MEEFRILRRLALVAALNCVAISSYADDPVPAAISTAPASQTTDSPFRSLLARGWSGEAPQESGRTTPRVSEAVKSATEPSILDTHHALPEADQRTYAVTSIPAPISTVDRPPSTATPELTRWRSDPNATERSLADLIRSQVTGAADAVSVERQTSIVDQPTVGVLQSTADASKSIIKAAKPVAEVDATSSITAESTTDASEVVTEPMPRPVTAKTKGNLADIIRGQAIAIDSVATQREPVQEIQDAFARDTAESQQEPIEAPSPVAEQAPSPVAASSPVAELAVNPSPKTEIVQEASGKPTQELITKADEEIEASSSNTDSEAAPLTIGQRVAQGKPLPEITPEGEMVDDVVKVETPESTSVLTQADPVDSALADVAVIETVKPSAARTANSNPTLYSGAQTSKPRTLAAVPQRSRRVANQDGFGMLSLDRLDQEDKVAMDPVHHGPSMTATIHATKLRELAQESLGMARHRLQRQATHSAKKYATEALHSVVAMQDSTEGGNRHAAQLQIAMTAIRESKDFCGQFGPVDHAALVRLVAVHDTDVLKDKELGEISSLRATEMYLAFARTNLVAAADSVREASDALVLLGRIEGQMSRQSDTHATAVTVTLHRAAVEIDPNSGHALRELGRTLSGQGLLEQAAWALNRSVELQPTRGGYESLLDVSRKLGDVDLARRCLTAVNDERVPDDFPVFKLRPEQFAATHQPEKSQKIRTDVRTVESAGPPSDSKNTRISNSKSWFPFGRR